MTQMFNLTQYRDEQLAMNHSERNVHDHLKHLTVAELQDVSRQDRQPWHTCLINVTGDMNIGTMIRTSHCLGANSVTIFGRRRYDKRGTVGSENYIRVDRVSAMTDDTTCDAREFWNLVDSRRWLPIFAETGGTPLCDVDWQLIAQAATMLGREICIVMGNETNGIPNDFFRAGHSTVVSIRQRGVIRSLNVSSAHAIISSAMCSDLGWM